MGDPVTDYARIVNGSVDRVTGALPPSARRLDTQEWVLGLPDAPTALQEACGWFAVAEAPRPPDTDTTTHTSSVVLIAGAPTRTWTSVPKPPVPPTAEERLAAAAAALAALDTIAAPVLTADVLDVLVDVRNALEA